MSIQILPTDTLFRDSPDAGHPQCLCSRCGKKLEEWHHPIRAWPEKQNAEYRFHLACIGLGKDRTKEEWEAENEAFYDDIDFP
ncbi:hypothetical protein [Spirosoma endbachense]|uniref:Uncharacterized protein n=1 Tax=Spirosoma endbachense TaxID=2666025 RepID=A0A6P1W5E3_9BACT|nr:hypothetical protein [Spirosoma endbachense]QHV99247.1 hypothetical protein GJR95_31410 [Spirosoma endbachense]